uniref:hypothetical protein n=1 Tax=Streptococcus pluranimalium TaxID=82348 RepID=UPI003F692091
MNTLRDLRFPKQFGDFAESLVMYVLGLSNWSVALIDHVGADVIAVGRDNNKKRMAISVKGRNFPSTESKFFDFDRNNIDKLRDTANLLRMIPAVSFVFVDFQEGVRKIRIIMTELSDLESLAIDKNIGFVNLNAKSGIQIKFTQSKRISHLQEIKANKRIFYTELEFNCIGVFSE